MIEDRFRTMGAGEIADLLDENELEGRDYFNCVYRAMVLLREQAQTEAAKPVVAWQHDIRPGQVCSDEVKKIWLSVKPQYVEHYTIPLSLLSAAPKEPT